MRYPDHKTVVNDRTQYKYEDLAARNDKAASTPIYLMGRIAAGIGCPLVASRPFG